MTQATKTFLLATTALALGLCEWAAAADVAGRASPSAYSWTGYYVGTHFGYATGSADWTATQPGAAKLTGSLDFFSRAGGLFGGLQAGYLQTLPSNMVVGVEVDASFPNYLNSGLTIASPAIGQATYTEAVQAYGTTRGRIGHAFDHWLLYATGGFAWSYNKFTRTQDAGLRSAALPFPVLMNWPSRCAPVGRSGRASRRRSCRRGLRDWSTFIPTSATPG